MKNEHVAGPLRGPSNPYSSFTESMAGQPRNGLAQDSLQNAVDFENHGSKSKNHRHVSTVVISARKGEVPLSSLTPVSV